MAFNEMLQILITANGSQAVGEFQKVGAAAKTNLGAAEKASGGFAAGFKKNAWLIAGGALVVGAALKVSIDAYEEQRLAEVKLQAALKNNPRLAGESADAFLRQASALQKVTVAGDEQIVGAQAMLGTFRMNKDEILALTPLVVDLSRRFGVDLDTAAKQVGKAMDGNVGALKRNGITIDETRFKTDRFGAVLEALRTNAGGFARAEGKTLTGQLMILRNVAGEVAEAFGAAVVPVLTDVISVARDVGGTIDDILRPVGGLGKAVETYYKILASPAFAAKDVLGKGLDVDAMAEELSKANKKAGDSAGVAAEQFRRQQDAVRAATDAIFGLIDADLAAENATLRVESASRRYTDAVTENGAGSLEAREALNSYKSAIVGAAKAAGDAAAAALGPNSSAAQKQVADTRAQIDTLRFLAGSAAPEARTAIEAYIAELRKTPGAISTKINADTAGFWASVGQVRSTLQGIGRSFASPAIAGRAGGAFTPFAAGGVVKRPTFGLIGEAGPEAVVPLSNPSRAAQVMSQAGLLGGTSGGGGNVYVTITAPTGADRAAIGRELRELLDAYGLRSGSSN